MSNRFDNCFDMKCPDCGRTDEIDIAATVYVRLYPDGTDALTARNGDHEWGNHSPAVCCACEYAGTVGEFIQVTDHKEEKTVIIEVLGGVAHIKQSPPDITVKIIDYDTPEKDGAS
jgi:hypothetical protein